MPSNSTANQELFEESTITGVKTNYKIRLRENDQYTQTKKNNRTHPDTHNISTSLTNLPNQPSTFQTSYLPNQQITKTIN